MLHGGEMDYRFLRGCGLSGGPWDKKACLSRFAGLLMPGPLKSNDKGKSKDEMRGFFAALRMTT
jgi:hypothetical protein